MVDVRFTALSAAPVLHAATPQLAARVQLQTDAAVRVQSILLRCQARIEPQRRTYDDDEAKALSDVFGERARWADTLRTMLLTTAVVVVPEFSAETTVEIPLPCSLDLAAATTKYFRALRSGSIPIRLLFGGTIFHGDPVRAQPISWQCEAAFDLPIEVWQRGVDHYYPGSAPLVIGRDAFDRLERYRGAHALLTMEHAIEKLLAESAQ